MYSAAGRRLLPPIRLGCPAVRMSCPPSSTRLLVLQADGQLRVWDFALREVQVEASVAPLLAQLQQQAQGGQQQQQQHGPPVQGEQGGRRVG